MFTFEEIGCMLDEICEEIPQPFFERLNGGINLLPDAKMHEQAINGDLYIMGEYHHDALGRYINIYYGSIMKSCVDYTPERMRRRLKKLLLHEFTHHIEAQAGERTLEIKDEERMEEYRSRSGRAEKRRKPLARRRSEAEPWEKSGDDDPWS